MTESLNSFSEFSDVVSDEQGSLSVVDAFFSTTVMPAVDQTVPAADPSLADAPAKAAHSKPSKPKAKPFAATVIDAPAAVEADVSIADAAVDAAPAAQGPDLFAAFGLAKPLLAAIHDLGYTKPTPVQEKTIPLAMKSQASGAKYNDLMVSSQTGSGKTAAYLLPVLHTLHADVREREQQAQQEHQRLVAEGTAPPKSKRRNPYNQRSFQPATPGALILCPTRELAQQVANDAIDLARHMVGVRVATVIGGLPYQQQIARLQNANLVVATPGRLLDLQRSRQIMCESVKFLVVDEADRMLDLGFSDDLAEINQLTAERQQTMMFSATFEARIQGLAKRVMREPQRVTIDTPQERHANIKQTLYWADSMTHRRKVLDHLMRDVSIAQAIVFVSTQLECDGLAGDLADAGFSAGALHGALSQRLRNTRLGLFRDGRIQFLIATDVAARGLDVPNISHVFNYGLPMKAEDYVHRIGRTGRAGRDGQAITIAEHRDRRKVGDIEHYTKQRLNAEVIVGLEPSAPKREVPTRTERGRDRDAKRSFGGEAKRPFNDTRRAPGGDPRGLHTSKPPFGHNPRPFGDNQRPVGDHHRPFGDQQRPFGGHQRPHTENHRPHLENQRPQADGPRPYGNDNRPFNDNRRPGGDGAQRPFGDAKRSFGDKPPFGGPKPGPARGFAGSKPWAAHPANGPAGAHASHGPRGYGAPKKPYGGKSAPGSQAAHGPFDDKRYPGKKAQG